MVMPEFDAELHDRTTREIGYNEGKAVGIAEGRTAGIALGTAAAICDTLSDVCRLPDTWRERIMSEQDINMLKAWFRIARHAGSLDEFLEKTGLVR